VLCFFLSLLPSLHANPGANWDAIVEELKMIASVDPIMVYMKCMQAYGSPINNP
jgi:hypothetical protein